MRTKKLSTQRPRKTKYHAQYTARTRWLGKANLWYYKKANQSQIRKRQLREDPVWGHQLRPSPELKSLLKFPLCLLPMERVCVCVCVCISVGDRERYDSNTHEKFYDIVSAREVNIQKSVNGVRRMDRI